jgi:antitoxin MazE
MKTNVVRIGNSRGIRIPKTLLEQCHLTEAIEIEVQGNQLIIRPVTRPRSGWDEAFSRMHQHGDDQLLDQETRSGSHWDRNEWRW